MDSNQFNTQVKYFVTNDLNSVTIINNQHIVNIMTEYNLINIDS
jgi:hypothetical protein